MQYPTPPQLLIELTQEVESDNMDMNKVTSLVKQDIGLSSSVLKLINSSFYNFNDEITSIEQAVSLIGSQKIGSLIIPPAYKNALSGSVKHFEDISEHSHMVGLISEIIAREIETDMQGLYYLAGLFHDVGTIVLACKYPDYHKFHEEHNLSPITLPLFEKERYGMTHTGIGVLLAKKWHLPNEVCNAIFLHHHVYGIYLSEVNQRTTTLAAVLKLADYLYDKIMHGSTNVHKGEYYLMQHNAAQELMLDEQALSHIESEALNL